MTNDEEMLLVLFKRILDFPKLTHGAELVLMSYLLHGKYDEQTGKIVNELARVVMSKKLGLDKRTVSKYLSYFRNLGFLDSISQFNDDGGQEKRRHFFSIHKIMTELS